MIHIYKPGLIHALDKYNKVSRIVDKVIKIYLCSNFLVIGVMNILVAAQVSVQTLNHSVVFLETKDVILT